jgi:CspA family cold shock protein
MLTGTIKFFNKSKGFGFITADTGGKEVFLPSTTVAASGLKKVEPGLRVSFEEQADVKGPKAVALALLDEPRRAPPPPPAPSTPPRAAPAGATLYGDPESPRFEAVAAALAGQGLEIAAVDIAVTPPDPQELKKWSLALAGSDAGLVRRSDPLFFALQLDDRFISESDFWLAISQHPTLINGPVVKTGNKLAICRNAEDVRRLLGAQEADGAPRPKGISARLSAMIRGEAVPPEEDDEDEIEDVVEDTAPAPLKVEAKAKKDVVKVAAKKAVKPEAAPARKKVAAAKKPAAKPQKR